MKKTFLLCLFISCMTLTGFSQAFDQAGASKTLKDQASKMGQALLQSDFKTFCHYAYPKLLTMMGGEDKMIAVLKQSMDQVKTQGIEIKTISYEDPGKAFKVGNNWQSTVVQHTMMKLPSGKMAVTSTLLAFSQDNGKDWTFMDTSNKDAETIRKMV